MTDIDDRYFIKIKMEYTIYSITCIDKKVKGIYVGSTNDLVKRKKSHKHVLNDETNNIKLYNTIRANGGWVNWEIKILESFTCETQHQAFIKERYYIDKWQADLNIKRPYRTLEEKKLYKTEYGKLYNIEHKEEILKQTKQFYIENKNKILKYRKQFRLDNKEKIAEQEKTHYDKNKNKILEKQRQFRLDNKEKIAEHDKKYQVENAERIKQQKAERIFCPHCDLYHRRGDKVRHSRSKLHLDNLAKITDV